MAEVFLRHSSSIKAESRDGEVNAIEQATGSGLALRVISDGRLGFSYSNSFENVKQVADDALVAMKFTQPDEFLDLPGAQAGYPDMDNRDPEIAGMTAKRAIEYAISVERAARDYDKRVNRVRKASATFGNAEVMVVNSLGLSHGYGSTSAGASISLAAEEGGDSQMGWGFDYGRSIKEVDFIAAGEEGARRAVQMLSAQKARTARVNLVLDSSVAVDFLSVLGSMMSAENVQKNKSLLAKRMDDKILNDIICIVDNPLLPESPSRKPMDAEGVAARSNILVEAGVLKGFMHNTHTARKAGTVTTGNAVRAGETSTPAVGALNLYFDTPEGEKNLLMSQDELFSEAGAGLFVTDAMGVHTINPISGEYSIGVSGIMIKDGTLAYPVREAVISGNVLDLLRSTGALGNDLRFYGSVGAPSMLVWDIDLSA